MSKRILFSLVVVWSFAPAIASSKPVWLECEGTTYSRDDKPYYKYVANWVFDASLGKLWAYHETDQTLNEVTGITIDAEAVSWKDISDGEGFHNEDKYRLDRRILKITWQRIHNGSPGVYGDQSCTIVPPKPLRAPAI
jgi:hypothetical protein